MHLAPVQFTEMDDRFLRGTVEAKEDQLYAYLGAVANHGLRQLKIEKLDNKDWYVSLRSEIGSTPVKWEKSIPRILEISIEANASPEAADAVKTAYPILYDLAVCILKMATRSVPGKLPIGNKGVEHHKLNAACRVVLTALLDLQVHEDGVFQRLLGGGKLENWSGDTRAATDCNSEEQRKRALDEESESFPDREVKRPRQGSVDSLRNLSTEEGLIEKWPALCEVIENLQSKIQTQDKEMSGLRHENKELITQLDRQKKDIKDLKQAREDLMGVNQAQGRMLKDMKEVRLETHSKSLDELQQRDRAREQKIKLLSENLKTAQSTTIEQGKMLKQHEDTLHQNQGALNQHQNSLDQHVTRMDNLARIDFVQWKRLFGHDIFFDEVRVALEDLRDEDQQTFLQVVAMIDRADSNGV